jgi:hypothetical protein
MIAPAARQTGFSVVLVQALRFIEEDQLPTGEIPNYRKLENCAWEYYFSPLVSAYIADALATFDPLSYWFDPFVVEQAGERRRFEVSRTAARIRRQIQRFVAWQQSSDDAWRFLGRGSSLPPDRDTTACCALALLDRISVNNAASAGRVVRLLRRLSAMAGDTQAQNECATCVADVNVLRFTVLAGGEVRSQATDLFERCLELGTASQPCIPVLYALGRAWRQCNLKLFEPRITAWVDALIGLQTPEGSFDGPLSTAMGLTALLDFGYDGKATATAAEWLYAYMNLSNAPKMDAFCNNLRASPALTTAVAISALSRAFQ